MKKLAVSVLLLILVLSAALAGAQSATYTPGEKAWELVFDTLKSGRMLCGDIVWSADLNSDILAQDAETAAKIGLAQQVIGMTHLSGSVGLLDNGIRLSVGAAVQNGQSSAGFEGALHVTDEGISMESNVIPGEKLVINWMDLYALLAEEFGLPQDPSSVDWNAVMSSFIAQASTIAEQAGTWIEPYARIFDEHRQRWAVEVSQDVPAEGSYPAADEQVVITLTSADIASFVTDIAAQLEQDQQFTALIEAVGAMFGVTDASVDVSQIAGSLRAFAQNIGAKNAQVTLGIGYSDTDAFLIVQVKDDDQTVLHGNLLLNATDRNHMSISTAFIDSGSNGLSYTLKMTGDDAAQDVSQTMLLVADNQTVLDMDMDTAVRQMLTEAELPAVSTSHQLVLKELTEDIGTVQISTDHADTVTYLTTGGGEAGRQEAVVLIDVEGEQLCTVQQRDTWILEPAENGITGAAEGFISTAELGINSISYKATVTAEDYDPAESDALTPFNLLTSTEEDFDALAQRAQLGLRNRMLQVLALLPDDVLNQVLPSDAM